MRVGDQFRLLRFSLLGALAPGGLVAMIAVTSGKFPVWWAVVAGLASGALTGWAATTIFGLTQIAQLAAHAVHAGRNYYFEQIEIRVVFDDGGTAWLRLHDVRACIGGDAGSVRHFHSNEAALVEGMGRHIYLSAEGVRRYLKTNRHAARQKFHLWFERELLAPIEQRRTRGLPLHATGE
jgi:hypothetical protein